MSAGADILTADQRVVLDGLPADEPLVMLNLLRFRETADYHGSGPACSGVEAYKRYSRVAFEAVTSVGGEVIFAGRAAPALIAPEGETWHQVFMVRYPSPQAFLAMMDIPEYRAAVHHRTAALADSRLVAISPASP